MCPRGNRLAELGPDVWCNGPSGAMLVKLLLLLCLGVAIFYNGTIFVFSDSGDLNNPNVPMAVKLAKDAISSACILVPLWFALVMHGLRIRRQMAIFLLMPVALGTVMASIAAFKYELDGVTLGILKNYTLYYLAGGGMAILAKKFRMEAAMFTGFRVFMALALLFGLWVYVFVERDYVYSLQGRLISVLGNPNYVGYLSALYLVVLQGDVYSRRRVTKATFLELILAFLGLILSVSLSAILFYLLWLLTMTLLMACRCLPRQRTLLRLLVTQQLAFVLVPIAALFYLRADGGILAMTFDKVSQIGRGGAGVLSLMAVRIEHYRLFFEEMSAAPMAFLLGTLRNRAFISTDGAMINIGLNFGIPLLSVWFAYFLLPVVLVIQTSRRLGADREWMSRMVLVLAVFLFWSAVAHFWLQYLPERYPTSLIIGWIMSFVALHVLDLRHRKTGAWCEVAPVAERE